MNIAKEEFHNIILFLMLPLNIVLCQDVKQNSDIINGWEVSKESYDIEKISELNERIKDTTYKEINGIVVIKKGKLLFDQYYNGEDRDSLHNPRSVGKTFASAMLGIALDDEYIKSVDQTLNEFYHLKKYDNYSEKKGKVTLKNFLTMTSGFEGFDFDDKSIGNEENMYPQPNWVSWALSLPMAIDRNPGDKWYYFTAGAVILGDILNQNVPGGLEKYSNEKLFKPLGITNYRWAYTPQNVPNTAGGLSMSALDFAKFGQLYKNGGIWEGKRILSKKWVKESFTKYYETLIPGLYYGYFWWNITYLVNGKPFEAFFCSGNGGNKIFVFTEYPLVVVVDASAYGKRYMHSQVDDMMEKYIIPAVFGNEK